MDKIYNEIGRELKIYGLYRHYKKEKDGEDMIYCVNGISNPCDIFKIEELEPSANEELYFHHTELDYDVSILRLANKYYHYECIDNSPLVIYTAMYGERKTYVRPLSIFLDKVKVKDKEKYRFELI